MRTFLSTSLATLLTASLLVLAACGDASEGDDGGNNSAGNNAANNAGNNAANNADNNADNSAQNNVDENTADNNADENNAQNNADNNAQNNADNNAQNNADNNGENNANNTNNADNNAQNNGGACDINGFTPARESATLSNGVTQYAAINPEGTPYDVVLVQIYEQYDGPTEPGTYSLDGINYADCGLCVLAFSGCEAGGQCEKTFYAEQGTVDLTAIGDGLGDNFAGVLSGVVFDEVTIDENFLSVPVEGGQTWCLDDYSYDQEIKDGAAADCESPDVTCVTETVTDFELQNCGSGEMVSLAEMAEGKQGIWFVLTAGWCPACREYIPQVLDLDDQIEADDGIQIVYVLGEDESYAQPDVDYCRQYVRHYQTSADRFYIDHDGQYAFATLFAHMWPYVDANGAFGLPWNAVVDAETLEFLYADGSTGSLEAALGQAAQP